MNIPKITVIIPIYNTELFLDKCLQSVINQTFKDIEIICIDDCSPDGSSLIVERYAAEDPRIVFIKHENNLGLGGARNTAIYAAKAEYIASVDSDDFMLPEMLETLWSATNNGKFDVVCCSFNRVDELGNVLSYETYPSNTLINKNNSINIFSALNPAFWNKLWRKSLYTKNKIFFPTRDYFEDMPTTPRILAKAKHIKIIDDRLYQYFVRSESISNTYSPKHMIDCFKGFEILLTFLEDNNLLERYKDEFIGYVNGVIRFQSENVVGSDMNKNELEQYLRFFLMLKITFFENRDLFKSKNIGELLQLLKQTKVESSSQIMNSKLLDDISKYKEASSILERENNKAFEEGLNYQNKIVFKEQENCELLEETKYSKELLNILTQENSVLLEEIKSLKELLSVSKLENIEYKDLFGALNQEGSEALTGVQSAGVSFFGILIRPFIAKRQYLKLKNNPRLFFKDSKSRINRIIGSMLNLI